MPIIVTGVGGPLGQAILKAARLAPMPLRLIGTDRNPLSVGLHWVDQACVLPDCSQQDRYLDALVALCRTARAAAILPGSDSELELLANRAALIHRETGTKVIASPPPVLRIGLDKLETCRFLQQAGLRFPRYASSSDRAAVAELVASAGFPLFAKPRRGSGSQRVLKLTSWDDWRWIAASDREFVVQEYLAPDDQEYTAGVFTDCHGQQIGAIVFRRELAAGNTYRAWVDHGQVVRQEAQAVVAALGALGPCNVQLRLTRSGPVTFEINPRFSGTTAMRAHFGYNEVAMALRSFVLQEPLQEPVLRDGVALRYWEEYYVDTDQGRVPHAA